MQTFGEFLQDELKNVRTEEFLAATARGTGNSILDMLFGGSLSREDADKVALAMLDYLRSDSFLREVDKRIRQPVPNQPVQEFLDHAKRELEDILRQRFEA